MRKVGKRRAVPLPLRPLARQQQIEVSGDTGNFGGVLALQAVSSPLFDVLQVPRNLRERRKAPIHDQPLHDDQHDHDAEQPARETVPKAGDLARIGIGRLQHREHISPGLSRCLP